MLIAFSLFLAEKTFDFGVKQNLNLKSSYVVSHKINAELLVLGPCEPLWMVSPEILTKKTGLSCYNLANSHSDFADNYLHLQLYLKNNSTPKYLLLYVTPESFDTNYNTFHSYRFSVFLDEQSYLAVVRENDPDFYKWKYIPFMKYAYYSHNSCFLALQGLKHYFTGKEKPYYSDGFEPPANMVWDNHHENLKKLYPKGYTFTWSKSREMYMDKILSDCHKREIKVILYESPVLKEIADYQVNRAELIKRIESIAKRNNGTSIPFIKFDNLIWAKDRKYFISPMVTTLQGSALFSDTLGATIKVIIAH